MDRVSAVQASIDACHARRYLEIGVNKGLCFLPLRVRRKYGVDPSPLIPRRILLRSCVRRPCNALARIYRVTSDEFFAHPPRWLTRHGVDVVFIDGMHTYEQSLRDVLNSLHYLRPGGIVLLHDCAPRSAAEAWPGPGYAEVAAMAVPGWTGLWSGDVWKTVVHLRATEKALCVFTVDCDLGIGVVTRAPSPGLLPITPADIGKMTFADLDADRVRLLGLRPAEGFLSYLTTVGR